MKSCGNTWAVVLAAGDGTRLAKLTTDSAGNAVPKQFCSLRAGRSLLQEGVLRANRVVAQQRVCVLVSEQHRRYWPQARWTVRQENVLVQPANRGTAHGVLFGVLSILARDPFARIVFLPADHHVEDESALSEAMRSAMTHLVRDATGLVLVGIEPEEPDPELGYIVPQTMLEDGAYTVRRFVEKPTPAVASQLLESGALWNSFIFAAHAATLLSLFRERIPRSVDSMATAMARQDGESALRSLYEELPSVDFSRAITQGCEGSLRVVAAAACGWSDLGTPTRVVQALRRLDLLKTRTHTPRDSAATTGFIDLAAQHARLARTNWGTT
jgi:mannose-1-phosphate guanylyltransferase/mannose-6-phosphate isomerase